MTQKEPKAWITVGGKRIPIFEGQSKEDAVKHVTNKKVAEDGVKVAKSFQGKYSNQIDKDNNEKEKQIAKHERDAKVAKEGAALAKSFKDKYSNKAKYDKLDEEKKKKKAKEVAKKGADLFKSKKWSSLK